MDGLGARVDARNAHDDFLVAIVGGDTSDHDRVRVVANERGRKCVDADASHTRPVNAARDRRARSAGAPRVQGGEGRRMDALEGRCSVQQLAGSQKSTERRGAAVLLQRTELPHDSAAMRPSRGIAISETPLPWGEPSCRARVGGGAIWCAARESGPCAPRAARRGGVSGAARRSKMVAWRCKTAVLSLPERALPRFSLARPCLSHPWSARRAQRP